jgi:Lar family restriction alleviation protein
MAADNRAHEHELKPCPFCGSADLTLDNLGQQNDWFVSCNICEIQQIANYTRHSAVALWNRRQLFASGQIEKVRQAIFNVLDGEPTPNTGMILYAVYDALGYPGIDHPPSASTPR